MADTNTNYDEMGVGELRDELERRGLPTKGKKPQLVKRLLEEGDSSDSDDIFKKRKKQKVSSSSSSRRKRSRPNIEDESAEEEEEPKKSRSSRRQAEKKKNKKDPNENDLDLEWEQPHATFMHMTSSQLKGSSLIAAYDYDWTIGVPSSGKKFAKGRNDWKWWHKSVPKHLKKLYDEGYKIVFFTNQGGIEKHKTSFSVLNGKFIDIAKELGFPIQVFISGATNHYRKPHTTMWDYLQENCNDGVVIDLKKSVYVGDAAGRPKNWAPGQKRDFSVSDRKFAANIGIRFETPEQHFLGQGKAKFEWRSINPKKDMDPDNYDVKEFDSNTSIASKTQEIVLFCGFPASGKSTFAHRYLVPKGYEWVNRDTLKTAAKCIRATKDFISAGKSVVVDNTSPSPSDRAKYTSIAEDAGVQIRCFWFQTSRQIAEHLNVIREKQSLGTRRRVPPVGFNMFKSKFQPPTKKEGFVDVVKINFVPQYENEEDAKIFRLWS